MNIYITESADETRQKGREFAARLKGGEVICLYGDLGAGKTVFASAVIDFFVPGRRVLSPTFIIVRHYPTYKHKIKEIIHVDLYRLESEKEVENVGLSQYIHRYDSVVLIEWAQKFGKLLPKERIDVRIVQTGEQEREFDIKRYV